MEIMQTVDIQRLPMQSSKGFTSAVVSVVQTVAPQWSRDEVDDWLKSVLPRFGTRGWGWTIGGAVTCAEQFLEESTTW